MRPWWPADARRAWTALKAKERARASALLGTIETEFGGFAIGQTLVIDRARRAHRISYGSGVRTLHKLEELGLLRRDYSQGLVAVWIPPHLMDASAEARIEDLARGVEARGRGQRDER